MMFRKHLKQRFCREKKECMKWDLREGCSMPQPSHNPQSHLSMVGQCYGLNCASSKTRYVEILSSNTSECDLFGNKVLQIQLVKTIPSWNRVGSESNTVAILIRRQPHGDRDTEQQVTRKAEIGAIQLQAEEQQRLSANRLKVGRDKEGFPYKFQKDYGPTSILMLDFYAQSCETITICCLKQPSL